MRDVKDPEIRRAEMKKSINAQNKIEPANLPKTMVSHVLVLFRKNTPLVQ